MDSKYKNEKYVKKIFNICAILQCLYYLGCIIVMIWYAALYDFLSFCLFGGLL